MKITNKHDQHPLKTAVFVGFSFQRLLIVNKVKTNKTARKHPKNRAKTNKNQQKCNQNQQSNRNQIIEKYR